MAIHADKLSEIEHQRRYNAPEALEVALIIPGVDYNLIAHHGVIILQSREVGNKKGNMVFSESNVSQKSYDSRSIY